MKKKFSKFLGVSLALVLVLSFSLVTAVPAGAVDPAAYTGVVLVQRGDATVEWSTEAPEGYNGDYTVKFTLPAAPTWDDMAIVEVWYGQALSTIATEADLQFTYYSEVGAPDPFPALYLDTTGNGVVDFALGGKRTAIQTSGEWVTTEPYVDANPWRGGAFDLATGQFTGASSWETLVHWKDLYASATVVYVSLEYGGPTNHADAVLYVDDITIGVGTYAVEPPTVTLDIPESVYRPAPVDVSSTTTNPGPEYSNVRFDITVSGPEAFTGTRADIFTITDVVPGGLEGINDTFVLVGGDFVGYWGPETGFPLNADYDATSTFTIQMTDGTTAPVGNYEVTVELVDLTPDPDVTLATATDVFSLSVDPRIVNETQNTVHNSIQDAIDDAFPLDTITVAAGDYAGAVVNKGVTVSGAEGGASVITSGVGYKDATSSYTTGFRLDGGADGAEIRNFTINCNPDPAVKFYFGVFAREADNVIVDSLIINHTVQGISNWGGSNWQITDNVIDNTEAAGGGGIAIFLGAEPKAGFRTCSNNLVQKNKIIGDGATATTYTCPGISLCLDARDLVVTEGEELTGNQILDNTIAVTNVTGGVGIEIGVIGLDTEVEITDVMTKAPIHDNTVKGNTIDGPWQGMLLYNLTYLTVEENVITNCCGEGIVVAKGHSGVAINYNNIYGNGTHQDTVYSGVYNDDICEVKDTDPLETFVVDYGLIDATKNWWGDPSGPDGDQGFGPEETYTGVLPGKGNKVSDKVKCRPWLTREFQKVLKDDIAYFGIATPALKGWNIVSTPLALNAHVTAGGYTANTWGGLLNLGKIDIDAGDDYALKLHYTEDDVGKRTYGPIYYYDSNPDSPTFGWREADKGTVVNPVDAYYIRMMASDSIPILFSPDVSVPSKKLYHGWNLVGCAYMDVMYKAEGGLDLKTALATIAEVSSTAGDVKGYAQVVSPPVNQMPWIFIPPPPENGTYIPAEGAVGVILIGRGYWVFMESPGTLAGLTFTPISLPKPKQ